MFNILVSDARPDLALRLEVEQPLEYPAGHRRGGLAAVPALLDRDGDYVLWIARGGEAGEPRRRLLSSDLARAGLRGHRDLSDREALECGGGRALALDDSGERGHDGLQHLRVDRHLGRRLYGGILYGLPTHVLQGLHHVRPDELLSLIHISE